MGDKKRVALLFGGRSAEHEVSVQSARNVYRSISSKKYDVLLIGISKDGRWIHVDDPDILFNHDIVIYEESKEVVLLPYPGNREILLLRDNTSIGSIDIFFPILHGTFGEDGTIQSLFKICEAPFVGAGVLGSAVGMDKEFMKRLLRDEGIPIVKFAVFSLDEIAQIDFNEVKKKLGIPLFVKPANLGSSVGISKVKKREEFAAAVRKAFQYDIKIIIEEYIEGRELECSVLGNENPLASVPGEIIPAHEFYSYEAKYTDPNGAELKIPAQIPKVQSEGIMELAIKSFKVLGCEGMARVDFFLKRGGDIVVNELNTIPGFTNISMYPKLWEASGMSQELLVEKLIKLGFERHERERGLKRNY
ncbi:MAG: D-alanine--D-alanine ligase [Spirochaetota bacterium]|nr:MAG: D-alanine--D-alanine ligase [Spirochaetota bacterium]